MSRKLRKGVSLQIDEGKVYEQSSFWATSSFA